MHASRESRNLRPVNLAAWRLQRGRNDTQELPTSSPPRPKADPLETAPSHSGARPASGQSSGPLYADADDNLRAARGVIVGVLLGAGLWALFIWTVFPA